MSPDNEIQGSAAAGSFTALGPITPAMVSYLGDTKPWVRLLSIVGFITSGLMLLLALVIPFVGAFSRGFGLFGGIAMGLMYLLMGCLYVFPSLFLYRYASAIHGLLSTGESRFMEVALSQQKSFWRLVGITTIVVLCLYAIGLVFLLIAGIGMALSS